MSQIPNHQILDAKTDIEELLSDSRKAPVKLVYAAKKNHDLISEEAEDLESFRVELLSDFAKTDEEGNIIRQMGENGEPTEQAEFESQESLQEFQERLSEIYSDEADLDVRTVDIDSVGEYVAPASWGKNLDFMFEGFETEEEELRGGEVQASTDSIENILGMKADTEKEPTLPLKFSSALYRTYKSLAEAQTQIEESRFELLAKYAEKDEEGVVKTKSGSSRAEFPDEESEERFHEELNDVYNEHYDVEASMVEIGYTDGVDIHPRHVIILDYLLVD